MQMYRVKFARMLADDIVDLGDVLVCAHSQEAAENMVSYILGFSQSEARMETTRVKPSFHQISRRAVKHSLTATDATTVSSLLASSATFPGVTESMSEEFWFSVEAKANIRAVDENEAISKLSAAIALEMSGKTQKGSCKDLDILCDRTNLHPRAPAVEQNALYTFRRIFQGGDTRT